MTPELIAAIEAANDNLAGKYIGPRAVERISRALISLAERQTPVEPTTGKRNRVECAACEYALGRNWKHCANCGREIKWL